MGGWARIVEGEELTDTLARPLGWWVIGDLSRIGYLEAWAKRGETVWKRRLALIAAEVVNLENEPRAHETLRIVRHVMESDERLLRDAAVRAVVSLGDTEETERFLAWWAPRLEKSEFDRFSEGLGEERMQRIRELA
jgi:hypothetical protein